MSRIWKFKYINTRGLPEPPQTWLDIQDQIDTADVSHSLVEELKVLSVVAHPIRGMGQVITSFLSSLIAGTFRN